MKKVISTKQKLLAASITMLIALIILAGVTFAWMTISTNPEVSGMTFNVAGPDTLRLARYIEGVDPSTLDYHETLNLSDLFSQYSDLVPVSTADLLNWYLPTYNDDGTLKDINEFILDNTLKYANIDKYQLKEGQLVYNSGSILYTEAELREMCSTAIDSEAILSSALANPEPISLVDMIVKNKTGYYVYADMWMTTDNEHGSVVRLSYPNYGVGTATERKEMQGAFGTYVMPKLALDGTEIVSLSKNSETAVRIGFLIYGDPEDSSAITDWYIYEPNADRHLQQNKKPTGTDAYVVGYGADSDITDGCYARTLPVTRVQVGSTAGAGGVEIPVYENQALNTDFSHQIIQFASVWNKDEKMKKALGLNKKLDSTYLLKFGSFISSSRMHNSWQFDYTVYQTISQTVSHYSPFDDTEGLLAVDLNPSNISEPLFEIEKGQYVKIRMFVWIEGQDIDCWNDVASGAFQINLEFSENDLHPAEE